MDQGWRNTCLAVAATGGHEALRAGLELSIEHLFESVARRGGVTVNGATMESIRDGIVIDGQCEGDRWPYGATTATPRPADLGPIYHTTVGEVMDFDLDRMRAELSSDRAVVLGLHLTLQFLAGAPLPISAGPTGEPRFGRHAVLVVGYDNGQSTITIKNSWGPGWSTGGYANVGYDYLAAHAIRILRLGI